MDMEYWSDEEVYTALQLNFLEDQENASINDTKEEEPHNEEQRRQQCDTQHTEEQGEHLCDIQQTIEQEQLPCDTHQATEEEQQSCGTHETIEQEQLPCDSHQPTEQGQQSCATHRTTEQTDLSGVQESSDENVPLIHIQRRLRNKRKEKHNGVINTMHLSDCEDSDLDADYVPSDDTVSYSDDYQTPVQRKRKGMRKRIRPLNREQDRRQAVKELNTFSSIPTSAHGTEENDIELQKALKKSKEECTLNKLLKRFAENRVTSLLSSNGLERQHIKPDGNCFFNCIIHQTGMQISVTDLRSKLCVHLKGNEQHYIGYFSKSHATNEQQLSKTYGSMVTCLEKDGVWNTDMSDVLPLATANVLRMNITIYSSRRNSPVIHITPDIEPNILNDTSDIKMAYLAIQGFEHYDSCVPRKGRGKKNVSSSHTSHAKGTQFSSDNETYVTNTPQKRRHHMPTENVTPRKKADYVSPKKVKKTRKRIRNIQEWKKNIRKHKRNTGQAYISPKTKQKIGPRLVRPPTCNNCKNKCGEKISEETRQKIFQSYYEDTMTFERKHDFICQHVDVMATSKRYGRKRKQQARTYYLPVENKRVRVCGSFFLKTLDIGKKSIECTLKRKCHGNYSGTDQRGRHTPTNKTSSDKIDYIKRHIESFPVVESHYVRKTTSRSFLSQNLSIRKMYELYQEQCKENGVEAVSEKVYRTVFCKEFNLSFHKPKKDTCQTCNKYNEQLKSGKMSESERVIYSEHLKRKEESRIAKDADKKRAKCENEIFAATFDLQAVLQTPCSNVSQTYYKRKLNSYNLTMYSLADSRGTCYVWNETHGQRGSSEIGTCVLNHLNSLPPNIRHAILYSDCCSGQNRNQFLTAGLLYTVMKHPHIQIIEQKFLESGHTQMECDSMHSAIEQAKKQTSLFVPEQWDTIFQMARRQNPYVVVPLRYDSFYDLKSFAKDTFTNFKTSNDGNKVNWLKVKVLKVQKCNPDQIYVKYSFGDSDFVCINARRSLARGRPAVFDKLPKKYLGKLPISVAKKNDLLDLCKGHVIPEIYWPYYHNLPTNKKVMDRLPCADEQDSESDTDVEL